MKKIVPVLIIALIISIFGACEKDDICVDGDTPLLIIGFFDANVNNDTTFKEVPRLRIRALSNNTELNDMNAYGFNDRSNEGDSIMIPLRIDATSTQFQFIFDSNGDEETGNIDTLGFSYTIGEQFVSRACGVVANYNDLDTLRTPSNEDWIRKIQIEDSIVQNNPTAIHVKIFH